MLQVELKAKPGGASVLQVTRSDGSVTWQKRENHGRVFAMHDLTHFAVESVLEFRQGFFGLLAGGWDIEETEGKSARGPIPAETAEVEFLVGIFDREAAEGSVWRAADFNRFAEVQAELRGLPAPRRLTEEDLLRVRRLRDELQSRWLATASGEALRLDFPQGFPEMQNQAAAR